SSVTADSTCRPGSSARSARREWGASTAGTSALPATPSGTSRTGATPASRAARPQLPMSPERVRANFERIRAEVGRDVTVVAATKYVSVDEMAILAEAGVEVVG